MDGMKTKQGYAMNRKLRARIILVMAEGHTMADAALQLGIHRRTLQDYLTQEVRDEILQKKHEAVVPSLDDVDKAMMEQACAGNVAAARLVYMRMAQRGQVGPLPTLEDMEAELLNLKKLDGDKKGTGDGKIAGDTDAMAAGEAGRVD